MQMVEENLSNEESPNKKLLYINVLSNIFTVNALSGYMF
jgi:hypothetical protein